MRISDWSSDVCSSDLDRREQLKAGITASTAKRRARLVRKNQTADKMRTFLGKLQVLQDSQIKEVQQKLAQAGIRSKDLAVAVIFGRMVLPILFGGLAIFLIYGHHKIGTASLRAGMCLYWE